MFRYDRCPNIYIYVYIYIPGTHLSFVSPPQEAFSQSKQASFGLQVYTVTIYIYYMYAVSQFLW